MRAPKESSHLSYSTLGYLTKFEPMEHELRHGAWQRQHLIKRKLTVTMALLLLLDSKDEDGQALERWSKEQEANSLGPHIYGAATPPGLPISDFLIRKENKQPPALKQCIFCSLSHAAKLNLSDTPEAHS